MVEEEVIHYFKKNVPYTVIVRNFRGDADGVALDNGRDYIEITSKDFKKFKDANKAAILKGLLTEIEEPKVDWETANAVSDQDIEDLLRNYLKLKNALGSIDSMPILYKIKEAAREKDVSKKTMSLIIARIDEIEPDHEAEIAAAIDARSKDITVG